MPVATSFVAKLVILVDAFLEQFVTVTTQPVPSAQSNCLANYISGGLTPCGQELAVDFFEDFLRQLIETGMAILPLSWSAVYSS